MTGACDIPAPPIQPTPFFLGHVLGQVGQWRPDQGKAGFGGVGGIIPELEISFREFQKSERKRAIGLSGVER